MKKDNKKHTIAELLRTHFQEFKPAEIKIANHLLGNYPMAGLVSITELSAACKVSAPTVMRTIRRIGFTSFISFQKTLKKELAETLSDPIAKHGQWATGAPKEHILNQTVESVVSNLRDTMNLISHDTFNQVVDLLTDQKRGVHLVGGRITHAFSDYLCTHLEVIRKDVYKLPASVGLWPHHLLNIEGGDVLLIFDVRRYEVDLLSLARLAKEKDVHVVLFTDQWLSPISEYARFSFPVHIEAPSGWDSGVATLFVIEALITAVECKLWPDASRRMNELEQTFDFTGRFKQKMK
ncbi:MAG: MurR/RpiR family transcriptional regulator [Gammaproteobacteria bacterium]|nr:MurR/RpiR family transcriptional regulator [Gammaproteobacteria bacterium]